MRRRYIRARSASLQLRCEQLEETIQGKADADVNQHAVRLLIRMIAREARLLGDWEDQ